VSSSTTNGTTLAKNKKAAGWPLSFALDVLSFSVSWRDVASAPEASEPTTGSWPPLPEKAEGCSDPSRLDGSLFWRNVATDAADLMMYELLIP